MKEPLNPEIHSEGDTFYHPDTITQVMLLPFVGDTNVALKNISKGKSQLGKWAKDNYTEIVGWKHEDAYYLGEHVLAITMFGKMLRPELAYKGQYPVFEHERDGYVVH